MAYVRGKGVLVGVFTFEEMANGEHLPAIEAAKESTGLAFSYADQWCENCVPIGHKIYVCAECDRRDDAKDI